MECKLTRKSNVVQVIGGKWERKVHENGEKYHMKSQSDVVSYILLSMSDLLISKSYIQHSLYDRRRDLNSLESLIYWELLTWVKKIKLVFPVSQ